MDLADITGLIATATSIGAKLKAISPTKWKGNIVPATHHFDASSIVADFGLLLDVQKFWVSFKYADGGVAHEIKATVPLLHPGTQCGDDIITLDGVAMGKPDFILSSRVGLAGFTLYHRVVVEFKFTASAAQAALTTYRFDGDI
jgi:hypothetical protein